MHPFQCPHCSGVFQITPNLAGQAVTCPHCSGGVLIPEMSLSAGAFSASEPPPTITEMTAGLDPVPSQSPLAPPPIVPLPTAPPTALPVVPAPTRPTLSPESEGDVPSQVPVSIVPDSAPERQFVIPTIDGGQAVIREPTKMAVSGTKRRQLRDLTSEEKSKRRMIKNLVVITLCGVLLLVLLWWLLTNGPI